jgi:putative lipoprotein (rSAM/lipoprotein system)
MGNIVKRFVGIYNDKGKIMIRKIYRILLSALLALLGFSCGRGGDGGSTADEYGVPRATYKAKGVVVSELDDSPIEGIRTALKRYDTYDMDTAHTDSTGSFSLRGSEFPREKLYVELTDVDGEKNGSFVRMEVEADYTNETFTGSSGNWYRGEAEIDLGIIKMKPEIPEEPEEPEESE